MEYFTKETRIENRPIDTSKDFHDESWNGPLCHPRPERMLATSDIKKLVILIPSSLNYPFDTPAQNIGFKFLFGLNGFRLSQNLIRVEDGQAPIHFT